jgi:beta-lactamase regulating signal transducer with metallopeptidase domain
LLLTIASITLPHPRLCVPAATLDARQLLNAASAGTWLGGGALVAWAAGAAVHVTMLAVSSWQTARLFRRCRPVSDDLAAQYGLRSGDGNGVRLLAGPDVPGPVCWQWQRFVIAVPERLLSFPADELQAVLRHELAHLRFGHPLQLFLQRVVGALYWFHPAVRWALRRASHDREFLCDAESVSSREDVAVGRA